MAARPLVLAVVAAFVPLALAGQTVLGESVLGQLVPAPAPATLSAQHRPMALGAASNFSQGWNAATHAAAAELGVAEFRDSLRWADVEREPGRYSFSQPKTQYPARLAERGGGRLVLTVSGGNPHYDGGQTPHSPQAVAAFGRFVAAAVAQFPAISAVEVGNEFNSADFVTGPVRQGGIARRARYHLALVRAVAREVRAVRPDLPVLGGATHSIPAGYLWSVLEAGEPGLLDGLAIHPYTTPVDQLPAQIEVLRRNALAAALPLHATEFGSSSEADAPDHLVRGYSAMASLGFAALDWYPLNERGDGLVPLIRRDGSVTGAGDAFRFVQQQLAGQSAQDISTDDFTFVHAFGDRRLVMWGEPRALTLMSDDIAAFDARGQRLDPDRLALSADRAIILLGQRPIRLGQDVMLGCTSLIADSFYQFAFPGISAGDPFAIPFGASAHAGGQERRLVTLPGQQRGGVPWVPYLGHAQLGGVRLTAQGMVLAGGERLSLILRWTPPINGRLRLEADFTPAPANAQTIAVQIGQSGRIMFERAQAGPMHFAGMLGLRQAGPLVVNISRQTAGSAAIDYRLRVHDDARCPA